MLLRQANQDLSRALSDMRVKNTSLYNEVQDMTHKFALNDEQTQSLKAVIRELEATLAREREFNNTEPPCRKYGVSNECDKKVPLELGNKRAPNWRLYYAKYYTFRQRKCTNIENIWKERRGLAAIFGRRDNQIGENLTP